MQSYFFLLKNIRLNYKHYFITKVPNNREIQQISFNYLSGIDYEDFLNLYKIVLQDHSPL